MATIHDKLDVIIDDISEIKQVQVKHEANLKEHMRRTELLEESQKPLVKHVSVVKGVWTSVKGLGALLAIVGTITLIYGRLF